VILKSLLSFCEQAATPEEGHERIDHVFEAGRLSRRVVWGRLLGRLAPEGIQESEELIERRGVGRCASLDLRGPGEGAGHSVVLAEPVAEVLLGPEGERLLAGVHGECHAVAEEDGLQLLE
jgi:hypothetical protein